MTSAMMGPTLPANVARMPTRSGPSKKVRLTAMFLAQAVVSSSTCATLTRTIGGPDGRVPARVMTRPVKISGNAGNVKATSLPADATFMSSLISCGSSM